jgi:aminoglycoside phosphotransferase (APT) family kinase protein
VQVSRAETGGSTPVYRVDVMTDGDLFFLRLAEEPGERNDAEVQVHEILRANGIPVPEIVMWERDPPELDRSAALTTAMPGLPLEEATHLPAETVRRALRAAGRDLARINKVPVRGFGWTDPIDPAHGALTAEHHSRAMWTAEYAGATEEVLAAGLLASGITSELERTIDRWLAMPDTGSSSLAHGDFDPTHIFVTRSGDYTGIIDFGEIRGADPLYDLGYSLLQDQQPDRAPVFPAVLDGYREVTPFPEDVMPLIHDQAVAIGVRMLAISHRRRDSRGVSALVSRLTRLLWQ